MNNQDLNGESIWSRTTEIPPRRPLPGDVTADAAVIGAGMAGILTAFLLSRRGISVIVLEADRIAGGQTKNTTAKITSQHGLFYQKLIRTAGKDRARLYDSANESAVEEFETLIREEQIHCHFKRLPSYLYSRDPARQADLEREARAASALGIRACFTGQTGLPFETVGAVRFENQAQFHPLEFIKALSDQVTVYEKTRVIRVKGHTVYTNRGTVTARHIVFATHYPFVNVPGFFFTRLHQDRSYCLGLSGTAPLDGMYYSVDKNGLSLRWNEETLLLGGGSHRTGKNRAGGEYERLARAAKQLYPGCNITARWSAQDCMSHDGIPFIGSYCVFRPYWHVATGFKKWGMTSSMLSAMIIRDRICGLPNPYEELFRPQRFLLRASAKSLAADLLESTAGLAKGAFHLPLRSRPLPKGHGGIVRIGFKRYACYRDEAGRLHRISARCPHLGCQLEWNGADKTWDCPCHGSRFDCDGNLIDNPAQTGCGCGGQTPE